MSTVISPRRVIQPADSGNLAEQILATASGQLAAYWKGDTYSGGKVRDEITQTFNTNISGSGLESGVDGQAGPAWDCNGTASYYTGAAILQGADSFTVILLAKPDPLTASRCLWSCGGVSPSTYFALFNGGAGNEGKGRLIVTNAAGGALIDQTFGSGVFTDLAWKFYCLRKDGDAYDFFANSTKYAVSAGVVTAITNNSQTQLGSHKYGNGANSKWPGLLQHMAVWRTALTDPQIGVIRGKAGL